MSSQMMLFETESSPQDDGSLVVRPRRLCTGIEVGVQKACDVLKFRDKHVIYHLLASGELKGWKPDSVKGNGKWRIDMQSILDYKARQMRKCGSQ